MQQTLRRWTRALAAAAMLLGAMAASGATLQIISGDHPQQARVAAFFREPIVLLLQGDDGEPLAGKRVIAWPRADDPKDCAVVFDETVYTDADGRVVLQNAVGNSKACASHLTAVAYDDEVTWIAIAQVALPPLVTTGQGPALVQLVSGGDQAAAAGSAFAAPWVVRAVDRHGHGVPYAFVFFNGGDGSSSFVTFNGQRIAGVMADAEGYAVSPLPVAGSIAGRGFGDACAYDSECATVYFTVQ